MLILQSLMLAQRGSRNNAMDNQAIIASSTSGIELLIGHTKQDGQLGRSRMKSDESTKGTGYAAVFGFNLRPLTRCLAGEVRPKVDVVNNGVANTINSTYKNGFTRGVIELAGFKLHVGASNQVSLIMSRVNHYATATIYPQILWIRLWIGAGLYCKTTATA